LGLDCELVCFPSFECVECVGDEPFPSVGVGGVTSVVGASTRFGGVAGSVVMIRFGATADLRDVVDRVCSPVCIDGGEACKGWSKMLVSRFFPPNSEPRAPLLVLGRTGSASPPALGAAAVDRRVGAKASFNLPTGDGDTPLLLAATSIVCAWRRCASSVAATESTGATSVADPSESIVSDAIRGEDSVRRPACDWCGEMPGLLGGLGVG
jgi:hypothetical protein